MAALGFVPPIFLSFTPVPVTLQTLGVMLSGSLLGARLGGLSQLVFLLLVAAGAPILSGGRGGFSVFVGPSAGFLAGYIIAAFFIGWLLTKVKAISFTKVLLVNIIGGIVLLYCFGISIQALVMKISVLQAAKLSLIYIPGDLLKAIIASILTIAVRKRLPRRLLPYSFEK
nr:biotin transporter BioY [Bacillus sp. FJAT-49736]